jgi:hypothetical protein
MSTTSMQFQTQQSSEEVIINYTQMLIEALKDNYRQYAIRGHKRYIDLAENVEYHQQKIDDLKSGKSEIDYTIETGKKYHKIIMISSANSRSVHAFVDKQTGGLFKSASWKAPAKGQRFNLLSRQDREDLFKNASWCGGYLYKR